MKQKNFYQVIAVPRNGSSDCRVVADWSSAVELVSQYVDCVQITIHKIYYNELEK